MLKYITCAYLTINLLLTGGVAQAQPDNATLVEFQIDSLLDQDLEGIAMCDKPFPVLLNLQEAARGRIKGTITYYPEDSVNSGVFTQELIGEIEAESQQARLVIAKQPRMIGGKRSFSPGEFVLTQGSERDVLVAAYSDGTCSTMTIRRVGEHSLSRVPTVVATNKGSYFSANDANNRCDSAAAWLGKFATEYPSLANRRTPTNLLYPKMTLLYADDDFVPVFGEAFDVISLEQRRKVQGDILDQCARDPLFRSKFELFSTASRVLRQDLKRQMSGFGIHAVIQKIRETRVLRHEYNKILSAIDSASSLDGVVEDSKTILAAINSQPDIVWPSERNEIIATINAALGDVMLSYAQDDISEILKISSVNDRISRMTQAANGNTSYHEFLESSQNSELRSAYVTAQQEAVMQSVDPEMRRIASLPNQYESLAALNELEQSVEETIGLALDEVAQPYRDSISLKRADMFASLVSEAWTDFESLPSTKEGLAKGADWLDVFQTRFSDFSEDDLYGVTLDKFKSQRNRMLSEAISEFEQDIASAKISGGNQNYSDILSNYMTANIDTQLPASLEYNMVLMLNQQ